MFNLLIISKHYSHKQKSDGMLHRIKAIDKHFLNVERCYLDISFRKNLRKSNQVLNNNSRLIKVNAFLHFFSIIFLLKKTPNLYFHSVFNFIKVCHIIWMIPCAKKKVFLDVHGAVPEECAFLGKNKSAKIISFLEPMFFRKANILIFVTKAMRDYYKTKYPNLLISRELVILPIINQLSDINVVDCEALEAVKKAINWTSGNVVFIYSGNLQKWQNIDLMLDIMNEYFVSHAKAKLILLTGEVVALKNRIKKYNKLCNNVNVHINNVSSGRLKYYYFLSNYGFALRDDHILNKIACPTKITDYLAFGIIPILKYENIGDFKDFGIEFVNVDALLAGSLKAGNSKNNKKIFSQLSGNRIDLSVYLSKIHETQ